MPAGLQTGESHLNSPIEPRSLQGKAVTEDQSESDSASENSAQAGRQTSAPDELDQAMMRQIMDALNQCNDTLASNQALMLKSLDPFINMSDTLARPTSTAPT